MEVHSPLKFRRNNFHFQQLMVRSNLPIEQIVASTDPIIRAIGMLDRRLGKRRFAAMLVENENPLVIRLYQFRLGSEVEASGG